MVFRGTFFMAHLTNFGLGPPQSVGLCLQPCREFLPRLLQSYSYCYSILEWCSYQLHCSIHQPESYQEHQLAGNNSTCPNLSAIHSFLSSYSNKPAVKPLFMPSTIFIPLMIMVSHFMLDSIALMHSSSTFHLPYGCRSLLQHHSTSILKFIDTFGLQ
jgi:hypothetical protein